MAKKIWYSIPLKYFWDQLYGTQKKLTPYFSDEQIFILLRHGILNSPLIQGENLETKELKLSGLELWKEDSNGDFLHIFFLDKQLRDFLENTPLSDLDGIRKYLYDNGKSKDVQYLKTKGQSRCVQYTYGYIYPMRPMGMHFH